MYRLTPSHIKSLFHRLSSLFEKAPDKRDSIITTAKLHVLNFGDATVSAGTNVAFDIEADATHPVYIEFFAYVDVAFNAATTNVVTLGSDINTALNIFAGADITEATPGMYGPKYAKITARTKFYQKYTQSGAVATTGQCTFTARILSVFDK